MRIVVVHNGTASVQHIKTDPKGNVTIGGLLAQCAIKRAAKDHIWIRCEHAKKFRAKPLTDYSHLTAKHHENATLVIAPSMPGSSAQLALTLPASRNHPTATIPTPQPAPSPQSPPEPPKKHTKARSTMRRQALRARMVRQIIQRKRNPPSP